MLKHNVNGKEQIYAHATFLRVKCFKCFLENQDADEKSFFSLSPLFVNMTDTLYLFDDGNKKRHKDIVEKQDCCHEHNTGYCVLEPKLKQYISLMHVSVSEHISMVSIEKKY